jgi:hemolysin III
MTTATAAPAKPLLRGWIHAAVAPTALLGAWMLWQSVTSEVPARLAVGVFGACLVGLYTVSSLYHVPRWPARVRYVLSRCDVAMIQLFIAAPFPPIATASTRTCGSA